MQEGDPPPFCSQYSGFFQMQYTKDRYTVCKNPVINIVHRHHFFYLKSFFHQDSQPNLTSKHIKANVFKNDCTCACNILPFYLFYVKRQKWLLLLLNGMQYARPKNGGTQYARPKQRGTQYTRWEGGVTLMQPTKKGSDRLKKKWQNLCQLVKSWLCPAERNYFIQGLFGLQPFWTSTYAERTLFIMTQLTFTNKNNLEIRQHF